MKRDQFTDILKDRGYAFKDEGKIVVTHKGYVYLSSLTTLPEDIKFENGGYVYLPSLTTLPEGIKFENKGNVYLPSLTTLPEGIKFENGGCVDLDSLTGQHSYLGEMRHFETIDGYTMIMGSSKSHGGYEVTSARYFTGGPIDKMRKCYVAKSDGLTAHGRTVKAAIDDLQYKIADNADKFEIAVAVRKSGRVTLAQFRGLTGACRDGIRQHLEPLGIDIDTTDSLSLSDALKAMAGTSYGKTFEGFVK